MGGGGPTSGNRSQNSQKSRTLNAKKFQVYLNFFLVCFPFGVIDEWFMMRKKNCLNRSKNFF